MFNAVNDFAAFVSMNPVEVWAVLVVVSTVAAMRIDSFLMRNRIV